ncbi:hypothetical protein SUGI_0024580 [Cryptomeria japonica]|nr:hypothetical protein SUGI_0024580 [Cryptomeria japonica]
MHLGLLAVFGEFTLISVRVVSIGRHFEVLFVDPNNLLWASFSTKFCGGTHLSNTQEAKLSICSCLKKELQSVYKE